MLEFAARAQDLGYHGVFAADHLFPPMGPSFPSVELFTTLAAVAAAQPGLTIGTLIARVGLRAPGMLAKEAAALDQISEGRAIITLGTGDEVSRAEHEMFGFRHMEVTERRQLLEETERALRALITGEAWPAGSLTPAMSGPLLPPPVTAGGPPIWIGGVADEMVRIAARVGDGWNGWGLTAEVFDRKAALLRGSAGDRQVMPTWGGITLVAPDQTELDALLAARAEKELSVGPVWTGTTGELQGFIDGLAAAGCGWAIFLPAGPSDRLDLIAEALRA